MPDLHDQDDPQPALLHEKFYFPVSNLSIDGCRARIPVRAEIGQSENLGQSKILTGGAGSKIIVEKYNYVL